MEHHAILHDTGIKGHGPVDGLVVGAHHAKLVVLLAGLLAKVGVIVTRYLVAFTDSAVVTVFDHEVLLSEFCIEVDFEGCSTW